MKRRDLLVLAGLAAVVVLLGFGPRLLEREAAAQQAGDTVMAPRFEVDPFWPKPLPNHWVIMRVVGVWVDDQDHVWMINRSSSHMLPNAKGLEMNPPWAICCAGAPKVLEFDQDGNLLRHWGGPRFPGADWDRYQWMDNEHGITTDYKGNVWLGGGAGGDSQVMKFTKDGKFLMQVGKKNARVVDAKDAGPAPPPVAEDGEERPGRRRGGPIYRANSLDMENFGRPTKVFVDQKTNEAYVSDGYLNHRLVVMDADTGKFKRIWGAYGNKPDDSNAQINARYDPKAPPAPQFRNPVHCVMISNDDLVYVCDRQGNRLQVFTKAGKFLKEVIVLKDTLNAGAVWDIAFSKDPQQTYMYMTDGENSLVHIFRRDTLEELTTFGDGGLQPGQFYGVHSIATDSKGNIYTGETYDGRRLQRFIYKGLGRVKKNQGALWPAGKR